MLASIIDDMRTENAKFARDVEYLKETAADDVLDERVEMAESQYIRDDIDDMQEAAILVDKLDTGDEPVTEAAEVQKILSAEENLTFEEMAGIEA